MFVDADKACTARFDRDPISVNRTAISGEYTIGGSCPLFLGTFRVTNQTTDPINLRISDTSPFIAFTRVDGTDPIPGNGSTAFMVVFTCGTTEDVAAWIRIEALKDGVIVQEWPIEVTVDVKPPPSVEEHGGAGFVRGPSLRSGF